MARRVLHRFDAFVGEELHNRTGDAQPRRRSGQRHGEQRVGRTGRLGQRRPALLRYSGQAEQRLAGRNRNWRTGCSRARARFHTRVTGVVTRLNDLVKRATSKALEDSGASSTGNRRQAGGDCAGQEGGGSSPSWPSGELGARARAGGRRSAPGHRDPGRVRTGSPTAWPGTIMFTVSGCRPSSVSSPAAGTSAGSREAVRTSIRGMFVTMVPPGFTCSGRCWTPSETFGPKVTHDDETTAIQTA